MTELLADWLASWGITDDVEILRIDERQFHGNPQVGTPMTLSWAALTEMLSVPATGTHKGCIGGIAMGAYDDNHRLQAKLRRTRVLVVDLDGNAPVAAVAEAVANYRCIVLETFSSTAEQPRSRLFMKLLEDADVTTYKGLHDIVREHLKSTIQAVTDDDAKDASRLSYAPVRPAGASYDFAVTYGRPIDARRVLAAHPLPAPAPRSTFAPSTAAHADKYKAGALRRAADALACASDGARHGTLNREVYSLARLGLTEGEIADALLPVAVHVMGEPRRREAERTIADAVRARRGAA